MKNKRQKMSIKTTKKNKKKSKKMKMINKQK